MIVSRRSPAPLLALAVAAIATPTAHAHLMNTGFGGFYDGLMHFVLTPEDLLPVIALALFAGLKGPAFARAILFTLPVAWLAGCIGGWLLLPPISLRAGTIVATVGLGILLAADSPLPSPAGIACAIALGLLSGARNGSDLAHAPAGRQIAAGILVALFVLVSLLAGQSASVRAAWARIAVRVAGSWIVAIGIFMLGWMFRATR
jgi:hydrogenase/urease accessory protein HupE